MKQVPTGYEIDQEGVGELVRIGIERGRKTRPNLEVGICGEHGGEPSSVEFCHKVGMDYVSVLSVPCAHRETCSGSSGSQRKVAD